MDIHEPWPGHEGVSRVIALFLGQWSTGLLDGERLAVLFPLSATVAGTDGPPELERCRALMALDWLVRTYAPAWLRLAGLHEPADVLAGLPAVTDLAQVPPLVPVLMAACTDAENARQAAMHFVTGVLDRASVEAWAGAAKAAQAAVGFVAEQAVGWAFGGVSWDGPETAATDDVTRTVIPTAGNAALEAAHTAALHVATQVVITLAWPAALFDKAWPSEAAWSGTRAASWEAVSDQAIAVVQAGALAALAGTRLTLQQSAVALVHRMAAVTGTTPPRPPDDKSPASAAFLQSWTTSLPGDERNTLLRLLPLLEPGGMETEGRRAALAVDWLVRTHIPAWLRLAGLSQPADELTGLPETTDLAQWPLLLPSLQSARSRAADAAYAASFPLCVACDDHPDPDAAVRYAQKWAGDAAREARRAAGADAAAAARAVAGNAAILECAEDVIRDATHVIALQGVVAGIRRGSPDDAGPAAWTAFAGTLELFRQSALALLHRMAVATADR